MTKLLAILFPVAWFLLIGRTEAFTSVRKTSERCCQLAQKGVDARRRHNWRLSNESGNDGTDQDDSSGIKDKAINLFDDFFSSSIYRTLLFTTPALLNPKIRSVVPTPITAATVLLIYSYFEYQVRTEWIQTTLMPQRDSALRTLQKARADRLSDATANVDLALSQYQEILETELQARIIIPSLWVLEFDSQAHKDAARNFLGLEITSKCNLVPIEGGNGEFTD